MKSRWTACLSFFIFMGAFGCSHPLGAKTAETTAAETDPMNTWVHIRCINQDLSQMNNLARYEQKFVIVPYEKLKTPGKGQPEKAKDETDDLYFERVSKMAEKVLVGLGLKKSKSEDADTLIVGLDWNTRKQKMSREEVTNFIASNRGQVELKMTKPGLIYLSRLHLKAVGSNKKSTRWEVSLESLNTDTFYLNVLPPLFIAGKDFIGGNCDQLVEKSVATISPEVERVRQVE